MTGTGVLDHVRVIDDDNQPFHELRSMRPLAVTAGDTFSLTDARIALAAEYPNRPTVPPYIRSSATGMIDLAELERHNRSVRVEYLPDMEFRPNQIVRSGVGQNQDPDLD